MNRRIINLLIIIAIVIVVILIDFHFLTTFKSGLFKRELTPILGLDLRGGMQVILQAPEGYSIDPESLQVAAKILENRSNALGVSEVVFQVTGERYIVGEFPGLKNTEEVIKVIKQTGLLEFVDVGAEYIQPDTIIQTDYQGNNTNTEKLSKSSTPTLQNNEIQPSDLSAPSSNEEKIYHTVLTGAAIKAVAIDPPAQPGAGYSIHFTLTADGAKVFSDFTKENIGKMLAIVLDKKIISSPVIRSHIDNGEGIITGQYPNVFTFDEANNLRVTLYYGSLPVSLEIAESRLIGPTLGQISLEKSLLAGIIGLIIVSLFMIIYYRLPGVVAIIAIAIFGLITYAIFLIIPVTLTLPGIAGLMLSIGSALDANILQFERFKEEIRRGRTLIQAVDLGWKRAWTSIRDSNLATIITSTILFWFGSTFGATIVKGFALTLALGVAVSLFTALFVTRTLLGLIIKPLEKANRSIWFGISE